MKEGKIKKFLRALGPGFITGASDDDPSGIGTYAQTGAQFGNKHNFVPLFTIPFMIAVQEMCGRIGVVTGRGIGGILRAHYAKPIQLFAVILLTLANTVNIGADLGAMAASAQLLFPNFPFSAFLILFTALILILIITIPYQKYASILKWLTISLFCYIGVAAFVSISWGEVFYYTFLPHISLERENIMNIVALLGTTISPYLFFWQSNQEVEEEIAQKKMSPGKSWHITWHDVKVMRVDTVTGMMFSNIIAFFIIIAAAQTLHKNGITHITTAQEAAQSLTPFAGSSASALFALGIIGTGMLAVPILAASISYAWSEILKWNKGLNKTWHQAEKFYAVIIGATLFGAVINYSSLQPFELLYYSAVFNGMAAPILIFLILHITNNKKIMGKYKNSHTSNILGFTTGAIMLIASILMFTL